ncbi:MAG TPA: hypothetical protein VJG32_20200 [Anaerolineae bacterium]|nr:hypothetical protein [Anaerolineae bacterium]
MNLREIGTVARLQIQRSSLKIGQKPYRTYDPSPLLDVRQVSISPAGVVALPPDGQTLLDVHHRDHPDSQQAVGNSVSIGFTANYAKMRERFGEHIIHGCAGENILIETGESFALADLGRGVMIRCSVADAELWLGEILVAHPCVEFSRYSLQHPQAEKSSDIIKTTLQFLEDGMRGFYATPGNVHGPLIISVGDRVYLPV